MADDRSNQTNVTNEKPQFLNRDALQEESSKSDNEDEAPDKKQKLEREDSSDEKKSHGNKPRPRFMKNQVRFRPNNAGTTFFFFHNNLCKTLMDVPENAPMPVCEYPRCKCVHDVTKFLQTKPPDIADECHVFKLKGHCPRGVACRFGSKHITENGRNQINHVIKTHYENNEPKTLSFHSRELETELRKRTYNFKKSEEVLDTLPKSKPPPNYGPYGPISEIDFTEDIDVPTPRPEVTRSLLCEVEDDREEPIGPCPDDDLFKLHLKEKKTLDWNNKLYLSPMANFGNLPFRRICKEYGADITCGETSVASSLLQGQTYEWLLIKRHENEDMFGVQIVGNNPYSMTRCAQLLEDTCIVDFIDVNVSPGQLPEPVFRNRNAHILRQEKLLETIIRCISRVTSLPITVCSRRGQYFDEKIQKRFIPNYKSCQVSLLTVHGRNRERETDWKYINDLSEKFSPIPVYGKADVLSWNDYNQLRQNNKNICGVQIGRSALVKPWIFSEIKQQRDWDISAQERFDMIKKFVNYGLEHWGSCSKGVELTRRFLLDWLSMSCRYVPLSVLETAHKLNDPVPKFVGRNDIEILLSSADPKEWLKISEILLGPIPEPYYFQPKCRPGFWPHDS